MRPFGAFLQLITDTRALFERFEAVHLDGGKVGKNIRAFIVWFNKAEPFCVTKPFDRTCSHSDPFSFFIGN